MARIYKDFSEFRLENKSIFKFLSKTDNRGLHEAIWLSRQNEVDDLKDQIEDLKKELEISKVLKIKTADELMTVQELRQQLHQAQEQNTFLKTNLNHLSDDYQALQDQVEELQSKEKNMSSRFEKSLELINQLEIHIQRQKLTIEELNESNRLLFNDCEKAKTDVSPLQYQVKELTSNMVMLELELEQYVTFNEQNKRQAELQDAHMEKLKSNSFVLKELAEKSKNDFKGACEDLKRQMLLHDDLQKKFDELESERESWLKREDERIAFIDELKTGVRNLKSRLIESESKIALLEKENLELKKNLETLTASEYYHRTELQKARAELEKARQEKEALSNELRWLNNTVKDVQNSLGQIHHQYIRGSKQMPLSNEISV